MVTFGVWFWPPRIRLKEGRHVLDEASLGLSGHIALTMPSHLSASFGAEFCLLVWVMSSTSHCTGPAEVAGLACASCVQRIAFPAAAGWYRGRCAVSRILCWSFQLNRFKLSEGRKLAWIRTAPCCIVIILCALIKGCALRSTSSQTWERAGRDY